MKFRIVYSKSFVNLFLELEKNYTIQKEIVNKENIFKIYIQKEIIYSNKDNFNNNNLDSAFISDKLNLFINNRNKEGRKINKNLDNIDLDEY